MKEEWRDIDEYVGFYQISNLGRLRSLPRKVDNLLGGRFQPEIKLKTWIKNNGYESIKLYKNGVPKHFLIHRLVASAFIPNTDNKSCVNHINGIRGDNRQVNLEWCTYSENSFHTYKNGYISKRRKRVVCVDTGEVFSHPQSAADWVKGNKSGVYDCCSGRQNTYKGYKFEYL